VELFTQMMMSDEKKELLILEKEAQLAAQNNALANAKLNVVRAKQKIKEYGDTAESLIEAMKETQVEIDELELGEESVENS